MRYSPVLAHNLRNARKHFGLTQKETARRVGVSIPTYQSYEEARALPNSERLIRIAEVFTIDNLLGFLKNPEFSMVDQDKPASHVENPLVVLYRSASPKVRAIVDFALKTDEV